MAQCNGSYFRKVKDGKKWRKLRMRCGKTEGHRWRCGPK